MICCDKIVFTPFCPLCGKKLDEEMPLISLLQHCRVTARNQEKYMIKRSNRTGRVPSERGKKTLHKWESWVKALEEIIELKL